MLVGNIADPLLDNIQENPEFKKIKLQLQPLENREIKTQRRASKVPPKEWVDRFSITFLNDPLLEVYNLCVIVFNHNNLGMKRKNVLLALTLMYEEEAIATWDIPVQFTAQKFDARMNIVFFYILILREDIFEMCF